MRKNMNSMPEWMLVFFENRVNVSADFYTRKNFDLIGQIYTEGVGGQTDKWANVATMRTKRSGTYYLNQKYSKQKFLLDN